MAKPKAKKKPLSDRAIVRKIKAVTSAIKRGTKTAVVKMIIRCTALTLATACGSSAPAPPLMVDGGHDAGQAGAPAVIIEAAAGEGGAASIVDAGPDASLPEGGAGGDTIITTSEAGAAGSAGDAAPVDPLCPQGVWMMCESVGYGYACQIDQHYGQHYQFACNYYCDDDDAWGIVVPDRQTRCEKAGGTCHCLGLGPADAGDAGAGACSNRYECDPAPDWTFPDAGQ